MATVDEEGRAREDCGQILPLNIPARPTCADALDPGAGGGDATAAVSLMQGRAPYIKQTCHLPVGVAAERRWVPPRGSLTSSRRYAHYIYRAEPIHRTLALLAFVS